MPVETLHAISKGAEKQFRALGAGGYGKPRAAGALFVAPGELGGVRHADCRITTRFDFNR